MRFVERLPEGLERSLVRTDRKNERLKEYLTTEIEDAYSARFPQEEAWQEHLRQYGAVPKQPYRNVPIEDAPNLEIPLGAIQTDDIYARMLELIFGISPTATARAMHAEYTDDAKGVQRFTNWMVANESLLRPAAEQVLLDDCQLGTGVYYIPWVDVVKKTDVYRVKEIGPRILAVDPKDFLVPGGSGSDLQQTPWCAMRTWPNKVELRERAKRRGWDIKGVKNTAFLDTVRQRREALGRTSSNAKLTKLYELHDVYLRYDYDGDGIAEDLLCIWDRTSRTILWLNYQPYDWRPFEAARYQLQSYLFNGIGIMELCRPLEEGVTEAFNAWQLNGYLANCRQYLARTGSFPDAMVEAYPGKVHEMADIEGVKELKMSDEYTSAWQQIEAMIALAQQRTGNNAAQQQKPISTSRTSGVTAMSLMQQHNRRFTAAFDQARLATSAAVMQCLYRYRERLLAGDRLAEQNITRVLAEQDGQRVIQWLRSEGFEEQVQVELTASSASVNKDADRQNALSAANLLWQYAQTNVQALAIAANPQTPMEVVTATAKTSAKMNEMMDIVLRTFDLFSRDPSIVLVDYAPEYEQIKKDREQGGGMGQLVQQLIGRAQQSGNGQAGGPTPSDLPAAAPLPNSGSGLV